MNSLATLLIKIAPVALLVAGCASRPPVLTPALQAQIQSRIDAKIEWPMTDAARTEIANTVSAILQNDLTPESATQLALLNNRSLRATFEEIGLSHAEVVAASRLHNPTLGGSVRWPSDKPRGPNAAFSLAADLVDNLLVPLRRRVAQDQLAETELRVGHEVLSLAAEVKSAVYTFQAQQQFCARLATIFEVNEAAADLARRQYEAGNINRLEFAQLQLAAQQTKLEVARAKPQLLMDREKLNRLLGLGGEERPWKISADLPPLPPSDLLDRPLEEIALRQRLDLAVARSQLGLAERALRLKEKTRLLPASVSLGVETERESDGNRVTGPSLELALPIFDQGQAEVLRLQATVRRARELCAALTIDVRSQVREARETVRGARAVAEHYAVTLLPQRELILQQTLLHYNAMQKSNYELLAAKEQTLITEREAIEARRDYWIARAHLERALGGRLPIESAPGSLAE